MKYDGAIKKFRTVLKQLKPFDRKCLLFAFFLPPNSCRPSKEPYIKKIKSNVPLTIILHDHTVQVKI